MLNILRSIQTTLIIYNWNLFSNKITLEYSSNFNAYVRVSTISCTHEYAVTKK